jgi:hypothetical protein
MEVALPIFLLAGGEIFLAGVFLRVAVWVLRGWGGRPRPGPPRGPRGGLRVIPGGARQPGGARERAAA